MTAIQTQQTLKQFEIKKKIIIKFDYNKLKENANYSHLNTITTIPTTSTIMDTQSLL
jgi:hypothetical protein